jgi:hypothetical protein
LRGSTFFFVFEKVKIMVRITLSNLYPDAVNEGLLAPQPPLNAKCACNLPFRHSANKDGRGFVACSGRLFQKDTKTYGGGCKFFKWMDEMEKEYGKSVFICQPHSLLDCNECLIDPQISRLIGEGVCCKCSEPTLANVYHHNAKNDEDTSYYFFSCGRPAQFNKQTHSWDRSLNCKFFEKVDPAMLVGGNEPEKKRQKA